ncbi:hypothetical protein J0910_17790 [Nocardiopsis sp. CNT-189]|uniref:hypothetical protein n=1 Tax=Nocardiopsis oceanisediminis TaxID=2816862 RepID=UPI003B298433
MPDAPDGPVPPEADRDARVAAVAEHLRSVVALLHELDLADTPPAAAYRAEEARTDAAL